ncbi:MAG: DUF4982 domain-containing protein [Prevotella sp.]|nr:DUF4982 domain-containing protein [Prevotella sp.]
MPARTREVINLGTWSFSRDGNAWETVSVPHDAAIAGPFDKKWDLQTVAITQNGETEATEKSGRSGALPWIGEFFYKTTVDIAELPGYAELRFDGAMSEPRVYVNGREAGYWAYGYNAFRLDVTSLLHAGENEISVHLNNLEESSRWYPGAGLYRPVQLLLANEERIDDWGTFVSTQSADGDKATLSVEAAAVNIKNDARLSIEIKDAEGRTVYRERAACATPTVKESITIDNPHLWSPETPYLYTLYLTLAEGNNVTDEQAMRFGVRTVEVDAEHGFRLNGVERKIKGVCLHHDLGPLGAAVNKAALIRQVRILKDMGCDAIRTSHNMPSTEQMEVYDSLGMMVMAESFDMWRYPKCKNGYARFFDDWWRRDITNLVLNHRNHPSCIMWSIGNEIPEQWSEEGVLLAQEIQSLCHSLDPTRPVTQGMDQVANALESGFAAVMDIPGLNYRAHEYLNAYNTLPCGYILGSETASTVSSRGVYKFPVVLSSNATYDDGQCNGYDTEYCWWSNLPEVDFALQEDYPWTIGQFVWTGFDYLGEPTPYDEYWPSRSSYFGICDLAGLPKDRYWLYRSVWNKDAHTVHLLPHWSWFGREGEVTPVYCYTDGVEGELFVNGVSQGRVRKDLTRHIQDIDPDSVNVQPMLDRYRLRWNNVVYSPGFIRVVVYDEDGNVIGEDARYTPGEAKEIRFECDRETVNADGNDLCYITLSLVDEYGHELPDADDDIDVEVEGAGSFRAICNGDATSLEGFTEPHMHLFSGRLVVTLQAGTEKGTLRLTALDRAKGIKGTFDIPVI